MSATHVIAEHIQRLRAAYLHKIENESVRLMTLVHQDEEGLGKDSMSEIQLCLHRMAGSAGTFGLTELGARARLLELKISSGAVPEKDLFLNSLRKLQEVARAHSVEPAQAVADPVLPANPLAGTPVDLKALIVGDDREYCQLLSSVLESSFQVGEAHTGAAALAYYQEQDADIILLDVGLPDMSGYEVCRQLESIRAREWRSVVFLSAHNRTEDKLTAYDAGGDDYFVKPVQLSELLARLKALATYTLSKKELLSQSQFARKLAFDSMAEVAQYGRVVDFMRNAMNCRNPMALVEVFFGAMDNLGLRASLRLSDPQLRCFAAPGQPCSPIETNLFEILAHSGRLHHLGPRTLVNGRYIGFLIKNMPVEDEIAYGRLKDLVAVIVEALDACYLSIARQQLLSSGVGDLSALTRRIAEGVLAPDSPMQASLFRLEGLMRQLESSFDFLDLSNEQEHFLFGLLNQGVQDASQIVETLAGLREELTHINQNLLRYNT